MPSNDLKIASKNYEECLGDGVAWSVELEEHKDFEGFNLKFEFYDWTDGMFASNIAVWGCTADSLTAYIKALKKIQKHLALHEKIANELCT